MAKSTQIKVYGKTYQIKADAAAVEPKELADYVDSKMHELARGVAKTSTLDLAVLTALNIAQELFALRKELESAQQVSAEQEEATARRLEALSRQVESALS